MRLKLQPVVVNCIEDLNRVVNNILTTYPEVSSTCIKSSLATLMESSKCKYYIYTTVYGICILNCVITQLSAVCVRLVKLYHPDIWFLTFEHTKFLEIVFSGHSAVVYLLQMVICC